MAVFNQLALTRACLDSLRATTEPFGMTVVDNGSTDGTADYLASQPHPYPLRVEGNPGAPSVLAAYNRGWRLAGTEFVCFLHNDTEMIEPTWLARLLAPFAAADTGLTGLYGAKCVRRDGTYAGRSIVHSLAAGPTVRPPSEEVAVVDGVCMLLPRVLLEAIGGFDEAYGFHGYDKDLSLAVRERGRRCHVVHAPFRHHGGGTRAREFAARRAAERRDLAARRAANARFAAKFRHRLPCDVRPVQERVRDWIVSRVGRGEKSP
jgi:GT2 family glycosyltransferase